MNSLSQAAPLVVDLDGTLVRTDTLHELIVLLLKKNFLYVFALLWWMAHGAAYFKYQLASRVEHAIDLLPYNEEVVRYLREEKAKRRRIILATASSKITGEKIAKHLGIFSDVLGSTKETNYKGSRKAQALQDVVGKEGFSYIGNSSADLPIWRHAKEGLVVGSSATLVRQARQATTVTRVFLTPSPTIRTWVSVLRMYQWVKNLLVFLPLIAAHKVTTVPLIVDAAVAFAAFSLAASAVYIANDVLDLEADRRHPQKKHRPFAAGNVRIIWGLVLLPALLLGSIGLATLLPLAFGGLLALYFIGTTVYSFYVKRIVIVDVLVLALLYTVRIFAGAAAISVPVSSWLTAFAMFFFLSLAVVKRFAELQRLAESQGSRAHGRGYEPNDRQLLSHIGVGSGFISTVILALYISSPEINTLYQTPELLWLLVPLLIYWIGRVWLLAHRGQMEEDPIMFAAKDRMSYLTAVVSLIIILLAAVRL